MRVLSPKNLSLLLGGTCFTITSSPCQPSIQKQFGGPEMESVGQVALASDGGFLIAGSTRSFGSGETDVYLIRTDAEGDTLWTRTFGGAGWDQATAALAMEGDAWLVAGSTSSFISGTSAAFLINLDDTGDLIWSKTYEMSGNAGAQWLSRTSDGGLIMSGYAGTGGPGMLLMRLTLDGDTLWTRRTKLIEGSLVSMNGQSVVQNANGEFLVFGDANDLSVCYYYMDQAGGAIATGTFNGLQNYVNRLHVIPVSNGGYLITGTTANGGSALETFAMRLDSDLNPIWTKRFGGAQSERASCAVETSDGGFAVLGRTWSFGTTGNNLADVYLLKLDPDGVLQWSRTYGETAKNEEGDHMVLLPDGGFCIAGTTSGANGIRDILLFTVDADGHGGCAEDSPATATGPISSSRTSVNRQTTIGAVIDEPPFIVSHGALVLDPCSGSINVQELNPAPALAWHQTGGDIVLTESSRNGLITIYDATGRSLWNARADEGTTIIPTFGTTAGAYVVRYSEEGRWSSFRFVRQ